MCLCMSVVLGVNFLSRIQKRNSKMCTLWCSPANQSLGIEIVFSGVMYKIDTSSSISVLWSFFQRLKKMVHLEVANSNAEWAHKNMTQKCLIRISLTLKLTKIEFEKTMKFFFRPTKILLSVLYAVLYH